VSDAAPPEPTPSTSVALPPQPAGVAWPDEDWERGPQLTGDPDALAALLDPLFGVPSTPELGES
jgi:hypothetical protein